MQIFMDYRQEVDDLHTRLTLLQETYVPGISTDIWLTNEELLHGELDALARFPDIAYVEAVLDDGRKFSSGAMVYENRIIRQVQLTYTYKDRSVFIGELYIVASLENMYEKLARDALVVVGTSVLYTFLVAMFVFGLFYLFIGRYLAALAVEARSFGPDRLGRPFSLPRVHHPEPDELDQVVASLNEMRVDLQQNFLQQSRVNAQLQEEIRERRKVEKELIDSRDAAESGARAKSEFLANMSHEIRTPLNGIFGMLELAKMTSLDDEQKEYVETALSSGKRLMNVLNDVLDFSRMEADKMPLADEPFVPEDLLGSVMTMFSLQAAGKGIVLRHEVAADVPGIVSGDDGRIRQILFNLVGNALKFTETGTVEVTLSCRKDDSTGQDFFLKVDVRDTGIGIPKEQLERIFEPFSQVEGSYRRKYQGTGLGLGIVKRLVELMRGSISIQSEEGRGTEITCEVLVREVSGEEVFADASRGRECDDACGDSAGSLRILVAEDDRLNQFALRQLLHKEGHLVRCVSTGREAVRAVGENRYDLVLMDIQMPEMDGLEATRRIRAGEGGSDAAEIPILATTAYALHGDRERFMNAGMDGYISKPVDRSELLKAVQEWGTGGTV